MKYRDDFGNLATIDEVFVFPYEGAKERERTYRLKLIAEYDDDFCYFMSMYDSKEAAIAEMKKYSCNTWKEAM